jgi:hypothetical protein
MCLIFIQFHRMEGEDACVVCLEEFEAGTQVRVLPCKVSLSVCEKTFLYIVLTHTVPIQHLFHVRCIDPWLVEKRTCPLCKLDVVAQPNGRGASLVSHHFIPNSRCRCSYRNKCRHDGWIAPNRSTPHASPDCVDCQPSWRCGAHPFPPHFCATIPILLRPSHP